MLKTDGKGRLGTVISLPECCSAWGRQGQDCARPEMACWNPNPMWLWLSGASRVQPWSYTGKDFRALHPGRHREEAAICKPGRKSGGTGSRRLPLGGSSRARGRWLCAVLSRPCGLRCAWGVSSSEGASCSGLWVGCGEPSSLNHRQLLGLLGAVYVASLALGWRR